MPGGGAHPQDPALFGPEQLPDLRAGAADLRLLRERGYALAGALKLVGDRYQLRERQRVALSRGTSEAAGVAARRARRLSEGAPAPSRLHLDGFNQLITCETALRGGVLVGAAEGALRDLAGVHGTWRQGPATDAALQLLVARLRARGWEAVPARWLLDAPVSNSGRLAALLRALARARALPWEVEVVPDPDALLAAVRAPEAVASADAVVLDRCGPWLDLAGEAIRAGLPEAWIVELFPAGPDPQAPGAG